MLLWLGNAGYMRTAAITLWKESVKLSDTLRKKATIHQVTTTLATSENVFPGLN